MPHGAGSAIERSIAWPAVTVGAGAYQWRCVGLVREFLTMPKS